MALQQMCKDVKHEILRITSLFTSLVLRRECAFKCVMLEILFYFQINKLIHYLCDLHVQGFSSQCYYYYHYYYYCYYCIE